ncbi:MAG: hypothetical protein V2I63_04415 [Pseudomonadales bacterium]|nr:hypothetical protein [Pseudomonadales bacterium]
MFDQVPLDAPQSVASLAHRPGLGQRQAFEERTAREYLIEQIGPTRGLPLPSKRRRSWSAPPTSEVVHGAIV